MIQQLQQQPKHGVATQSLAQGNARLEPSGEDGNKFEIEFCWLQSFFFFFGWFVFRNELFHSSILGIRCLDLFNYDVLIGVERGEFQEIGNFGNRAE
jgi:hypothetical protein